jgi:outer membrane protein insertion porin family
MRPLPLLLLLLTTGVAQEQFDLPNANAAYEGEKVNSIDLVANPHLDTKPFEAMLVQKAGQPYSEENVEASVAALEKSQRFAKVRTIVSPEPKGLRLTFVLEPAYYIGIISFPEAAKHFSYVRLLQVVNYSDEDPYDQALLPAQETALQNFLKANGYFQAQVHAVPSIDDTHQLVNITFRVQMRKQARLGKVEIRGTSPAEAAHLMHSVRSLRARFTGGLLESGKSYTAARLKEAKQLMERSLAHQHYLAGKVQFEPPEYRAETNRADLTLQVETGPEVMIHITGARLALIPFMSGIQEKKLIPIYSVGAIDRDLVNEGQQNLIDYFQKKGYFDVQVKTDFSQQPDRVSVTYVIDKGRKHKVSRILFSGNHALGEGRLLSHIPIKKTHFWRHGAYSAKLLQTSVDNIEALYRNAGYEEVKVTPQVIDHDSWLDIRFHVNEGRQTLVAQLELTGNKNISSSELAGKRGFRLHSGSPFSPGKMASDRNQITAVYLDHGYLNAEVKAVLRRESDNPHRVNIAYEVTENQKIRIRDVLYEGQEHTRLSLLRKATDLTAETPLSEKNLLQSETRLYDLDIFDWASVTPKQPVTNQTQEDAMVKVHEAKRTEIIYGFGFEVEHRGGNIPAGSVSVPGLPPLSVGNHQVAPSQAIYASPRGSIEILRHNMRGMAETASLSLLASRLDQRALASYADPHFRQTQWDALTSFSFERTTENPLYAASLADASFQLQRVLKKKTNTQLQLRYDFNHTSLSQLLVPSLVLPQDRNVRLATVSAALIRDTRDKPLDAHKGSYTTVNFGVTPTAFGSSANFNRLFAQYAFYQPMHRIIWANSIRLGFDKAFSGSFVPTSQLFFAGGGTTLRGFPIDEAGPQRIVPFCNVLLGDSGCVNVTVPVGGRQLFILNSELRFPLKIMPNLGGVFFYDGGNVYSAINFHNFVNNYTHTIGVGLRYSTPIGPIRFDIGRNLNPLPGIGATQYFITLGQAF